MASEFSSAYSFRTPSLHNLHTHQQILNKNSKFLSPNRSPDYLSFGGYPRENSQPQRPLSQRHHSKEYRALNSKKNIPSILTQSQNSQIVHSAYYNVGNPSKSPLLRNNDLNIEHDVQFNYFKPFASQARTFFSEDLVSLLEQQQKNISDFKTKIEQEKKRLSIDFELFSKQLMHVLDDLRTSLSAQLDIVYRFYIDKYSSLKSQVQEIRRLRKQIQAGAHRVDRFARSRNQSAFGGQSRRSANSQIIEEMKQDAHNFRNLQILNEISELQNAKFAPLQDICQDLIILGKVNKSYYNSEATMSELYQLKDSIAKFTDHMFGFASNYVYSPEKVLKKFSDKFLGGSKSKKLVHNPIAVHGSPRSNILQEVSRKHIQSEYIYPNIEIAKTNQSIKRNISPDESMRLQNHVNNTVIQNNSYNNQRLTATFPVRFSVSTSLQNIIVPDCKTFGLFPIATIKPQTTDSILCAVFIEQRFLAMGSRDKKIYVYTLDGNLVTRLEGHEASICTLSLVKEGQRTYLASGSDHGCGSIVVWDTSNWIKKSKFRTHDAAVSGIVDLGDGVHFCSGSYDKTIKIYSLRRASVLFTVPHEEVPLTSMVLTADQNKLVTCGLDSNFYIWEVSRNPNTREVQTIKKLFSISNNSITCCMTASLLRPQLVFAGNRDGRIYQINADRGVIEKNTAASSKSVMDIALIERNANPSTQIILCNIINNAVLDVPIMLSVSGKEDYMMSTQGDTSTILMGAEAIHVEFGCGVGPKLFFSGFNNYPIVGIVNQSEQKRQVNIYEIKFG